MLTSIIGPNGAGKTTLINLFTGMLACDSGRLIFDGTEITGLSPHQRVHMGISRSFQITNVFQQMTVAQNLQLPVLARLGRASRPFMRPDRDPDVRAEVEGLLADIGLAKARDVRAKALPHGDQRLLEIGMAIAVVFALSERVIVMHQGKVLTEGRPEAIRNHAGVREIYLGEDVGA